MSDILDLPGWTVSGASSQGDCLAIDAEYTKQPEACQLCGESGGRIFTICANCHRRFHLEEGFSHGLPSTT
jgi:hypothetical protein